MSQLSFCLNKDLKEYNRKKRHLLYTIIMVGIAGMVFFSSRIFPVMLDTMLEEMPDLVSDAEAMRSMFEHLFPDNLAANMGAFAGEALAFYTLIVIILVNNLLAEELKNGRWIIPLGAGYQKKNMILSKAIVNSIGTALPAVVVYIAYYFVLAASLENDYGIGEAIANALLLGFFIMAISAMTIFCSVIFKKSVLSAVTIIVSIMVLPDIFGFFEFGKYMPTYLINYLTESMVDFKMVIVPIILNIVICVVLYFIAIRRTRNIEVNR